MTELAPSCCCCWQMTELAPQIVDKWRSTTSHVQKSYSDTDVNIMPWQETWNSHSGKLIISTDTPGTQTVQGLFVERPKELNDCVGGTGGLGVKRLMRSGHWGFSHSLLVGLAWFLHKTQPPFLLFLPITSFTLNARCEKRACSLV